MEIEELAGLCKSNQADVKKALNGLKKQYEEKQGSLMVVDDANTWRITVREGYLPLVSRIVTETELSKTIIETLAVVAWKVPVLQSNIISIRTNKAYDHLKYLEEAGYITREKHGRTRMVKLAQKFFDYFDLPPEKFKEKFARFEDIEKMIIGREQEARKIKQEIESKKQEHKKGDKEKEKLSEKEHKGLDEGIKKLEKDASEILEEHETAVKKRLEEEEEKQEWKAIRLRKTKEEKEAEEKKLKKEKQEKLVKEETKEEKKDENSSS